VPSDQAQGYLGCHVWFELRSYFV